MSNGSSRKESGPTILLRSGWQYANIGDIGHWMGGLSLIRRYLPEAHVILWPLFDLGDSISLLEYFPNVEVVQGTIDANGDCNPWLTEAIDRSDLLFHGSGAGISIATLQGWRSRTTKPYGCLGVSFTGGPYGSWFSEKLDRSVVDTLSGAAFLYTRETGTERYLLEQGVNAAAYGFVPDATFAFDTPDDERANEFLRRCGLEKDRFIAVVPKLRIDPHWRFKAKKLPLDEIEQKEAVNERYRVYDNGFLCEAITAWVRETDGRALVCPEMTYEVEVGERFVVPYLSQDVAGHVTSMNRYWLPDEAFAVYRNARAVISIEMHSPILSVTAGTPSIHLRQPTDSPKGQMWNDLGLGNWLFELDSTEPSTVVDRLLEINSNYDDARQLADNAMRDAEARQRDAMMRIREVLGLVS